ncbi:hypothetical protein [Mesorhizobium sp. M7A.F.Ca.MR.362.00.0.0]|uniref:hypothetical protein n=1 Tax=Mesorhizobium sp. M7A.F.Ca.MR.362.00.0.0 TaxID=2496779 RepID=UPI000FD25D60|nr:hypothetical protein [Mesorhizobium sp. M7A.F.Ca.MR.362.00.0.0]RUU74801.1 hypothetical protein EOC06_32540 [Mesorhizobium sp. M7A.F.Ca.MR.362.00.0.0]RWN95468.1 MAG: hypothetical protein EOS05_11785 [Mesorhizobium sp.]
MMLLTGCATSGKVELPPLPEDIRTCFQKMVGPFPEGKPIDDLMVFDKLDEFIKSDKTKTACGKRLIAIFDAAGDPKALAKLLRDNKARTK